MNRLNNCIPVIILTDKNDSWQNKCILFLLILDKCGATALRLRNYHMGVS